MKLLCLISVVVLIISCTEKKDSTDNEKDVRMEQIKTIPEFQTIIDSANVEGAILICNLEKDKFYSNHFDWAAKGHLPASTFKIANSIIALETKVMKDDSTLLKWNREQRAFRTWEQDLILRDAFHYSCVPCYQEVARNIGVNRMRAHLDEMDYGSMIFDSSNIDMFWLQGQSHISQFQQVDFLKRLYLSKLPITERTEITMELAMVGL